MSASPLPSRMANPALVASGCVLLAGAVTLPLLGLGPLADQMVQHLIVMNILAPLAAVAWVRNGARGVDRSHVLMGSGILQTVLLWGWHAPALQQAVFGTPVAHLGFLALLFAAACVFWGAVLLAGEGRPWWGIVALLLTGKLACLLGGLLIFSPRDLYALPSLAFALCSSGASSVEDQQTAGLLMITACPLSYVAAAVVLAARMILDLERTTNRGVDAAA